MHHCWFERGSHEIGRKGELKKMNWAKLSIKVMTVLVMGVIEIYTE